MNTLPKRNGVEFLCKLMPALADVTPKSKFCRNYLYCKRGHAMKQRGVVLFFTLIALVVMSLAAVALIRSVDTSTMIAGNLAFKQTGTSSGDAGIEAAIAWLNTTQATMQTAGVDVYKNTTHAFNNDGGASGFVDANGVACCLNSGYHSNANFAMSLTDGTGITWNSNNSDSVLVPIDSSGNTIDSSGNSIRYVIQRMCRTANELPTTQEQPLLVPPKTGCLFSSSVLDNNDKRVLNATETCTACTSGGSTVLFRITARVTGPKNTVSYIQTIVY